MATYLGRSHIYPEPRAVPVPGVIPVQITYVWTEVTVQVPGQAHLPEAEVEAPHPLTQRPLTLDPGMFLVK